MKGIDITSIIQIVSSIPGIVAVILLWKMGIINFGDNDRGGISSKIKQQNTTHNAHQLQINELKEHAKTANEEMGSIQKNISIIQSDIAFIRGMLTRK